MVQQNDAERRKMRITAKVDGDVLEELEQSAAKNRRSREVEAGVLIEQALKANKGAGQ